MFREAFNRIQDTGSQKDWGTTHNARIYFDLSGPGGQSFRSGQGAAGLFLIFNFLPPQTARICLCGGSASAGLLYRIGSFVAIAYVNRQKRRVTFKSVPPAKFVLAKISFGF